MTRKRNNARHQSKPLADLSHYFLTSDDDDSDASEEVIPSSQLKKRIFQNPPRQKPRASLIARNLNEFVSSTPMHPFRKTFNRSLHLSPIENEQPEKQRRNSKSLQTESSKRKNTSKNSKKKEVTKDNSELGNKSELARPLQSTVSSEDHYSNNEQVQCQLKVNGNHVITRSEARKTLCAQAQTSFTSPMCKIIKSYHNVLTQTAADKGTQITDSLEGLSSKRSISRKRTTKHSSTNEDDNSEEEENDLTLTNRNFSATDKLQHTLRKDTDHTNIQCAEMSLTTVVIAGARKHISTGDRADISTAVQTDIPTSARTNVSTGVRANTPTTFPANASTTFRANASSSGARADISTALQTDIPISARTNVSTAARANTSTIFRANASLSGARADASTAAGADTSPGAQVNISTGVRASSPSNIYAKADNIQDHPPNDSQSDVGSESSWSKDGRKGKWLSNLLDGYFGESRTSTVAGSPIANCAELEENGICVQLEGRNLIEEMQNVARAEATQAIQHSRNNVRTDVESGMNVKKNNNVVQTNKSVSKKRRKEQGTKDSLANDHDDEVFDYNQPVDVSRHVLTRLSKKVNNSKLDDEDTVANKVRQVIQSVKGDIMNNTAINKTVTSNVQNDNHSYSGNVLSYDSHAGNADRTGKTNNSTRNKGQTQYSELSQMEIVENDIFTPADEDKSRNRRSENVSTRANQNRKSKNNEGEISNASRKINEINKKKDLQDAAEPIEDESNQSPLNNRRISARSCANNKNTKSKLEAFLLNVASISPTKINKSLPRGKRKNKEEHPDETTEPLTAPEAPSEPFQVPKINVIENRVLNGINSDGDSKEKSSKQTTTKKTQRKKKEVIPAIIVSENTDEDSSEGPRRSRRQRKERTILYNPQIIFTNRREFLQFSKVNTALQSSTIAELSRLHLDDIKRRKRSSPIKEKSTKSKKGGPRKKQKREQIMEKIDEEENNLNLVRDHVPISNSISTGNPIESSTLEVTNTPVRRTVEKSTEDPTSGTDKNLRNLSDPNRKFESTLLNSHISNNDHLQSTFPYVSQNNEESRNDSCFPLPKFNDLEANKNLRTIVGSQSSRDGYQSGWLEILPGRNKPKDTAVKFSLLFTVLEGKGLFQVGDACEVLNQFRECNVPLGTYYSIENQSKTQSLLLHYVKIKPQCR